MLSRIKTVHLGFFSTAIWQLSGGKHGTPEMRYSAYKLRTRLTLLITRCIIVKFRYFKKAIFHYFRQVVNLSATCFYVELEQVCQRQLGFLVFTCTDPVDCSWTESLWYTVHQHHTAHTHHWF